MFDIGIFLFKKKQPLAAQFVSISLFLRLRLLILFVLTLPAAGLVEPIEKICSDDIFELIYLILILLFLQLPLYFAYSRNSAFN